MQNKTDNKDMMIRAAQIIFGILALTGVGYLLQKNYCEAPGVGCNFLGSVGYIIAGINTIFLMPLFLIIAFVTIVLQKKSHHARKLIIASLISFYIGWLILIYLQVIG